MAVALAAVIAALGCRDLARVHRAAWGTEASAAPAPRGTQAARHARVRATLPQGAPLHPAPDSPRVSSRLPNGSQVTVLGELPSGRSVRVRDPQGTEGWVARRYLEPVPSARGPETSRSSVTPSASADALASAWSSREACQQIMQAPRPGRKTGRVRLGSWNIRWFPDGGPGQHVRPGRGTDLAWLGCLIASLDLDALAVQEFKTHARARASLAALLAEVDGWQGGQWRAEFDGCDPGAGQHVGILYASSRVKARSWHTYSTLNPRGSACQDRLRPGFGAYLSFPGGLDLHLVSVHSKSGSAERDFSLRQRTLHGLDRAAREAEALVGDSDLVFAGDYNTMGCRHCSPPVSARAELEALTERLRGLDVPLRPVPADGTCSEVSGEQSGLLDHFLVARAMAELSPAEQTHVSGWCELTRCGAQRHHPAPEVLERISDHCPIVIELEDRDLDE
jgi:hypothetical protein